MEERKMEGIAVRFARSSWMFECLKLVVLSI